MKESEDKFNCCGLKLSLCCAVCLFLRIRRLLFNLQCQIEHDCSKLFIFLRLIFWCKILDKNFVSFQQLRKCVSFGGDKRWQKWKTQISNDCCFLPKITTTKPQSRNYSRANGNCQQRAMPESMKVLACKINVRSLLISF